MDKTQRDASHHNGWRGGLLLGGGGAFTLVDFRSPPWAGGHVARGGREVAGAHPRDDNAQVNN